MMHEDRVAVPGSEMLLAQPAADPPELEQRPESSPAHLSKLAPEHIIYSAIAKHPIDTNKILP